MTDWNTYGGRLRWAIEHRKTNQSELARKVTGPTGKPITSRTIQHLCDPRENAQGSKYTSQFAEQLGVRALWLERNDGDPFEASLSLGNFGGHPPNQRGADRATSSYPDRREAAPPARARTTVPVVRVFRMLKEAGEFETYPIQTNMVEDIILPFPLLGSGLIAARVRGDGLSPYATDGQYLILNPTAISRAGVGRIVVVQLKDGRNLVRELTSAGQDAVQLTVITDRSSIQSFDRADIDQLYPVEAAVWATSVEPTNN